jgi:uncharacterized protein YndB with AHSA1/START domain
MVAHSWKQYIMITVEQSIVINRPPEQVFALLASFGDRASWNTEVLEEAQSPPGAIHIGTRITQVYKIFGGRVRLTTQIVELEPNRKLTLRSTPETLPSVSWTYLLEPISSGTRMSFVVHIDLRGAIVLSLLRPLVVWRAWAGVRKRLQNLKRVAESH